MPNQASASLMLQIILVLMSHQNKAGGATADNVDGDKRRCYGDYGCFELKNDNFMDVFPQAPEVIGVKYAVFTRRNRDIPVFLQANDTDKIRNANFDTEGPFYFIAHGYQEGGDKIWIQDMTNALLDLRGNAKATVFDVDWRLGAKLSSYPQAVANMRLVGIMTAHLIHNIYEAFELSHLNNFHFIGYNLGAHLGGYCGHTLQQKFKLKLGRITGLSPAGHGFTNMKPGVPVESADRLDRPDADYVDIINTDISKWLPLRRYELYVYADGASPEHLGHMNFYPNGGSWQPGCMAGDWDTTCWEKRSYEYFIESIAPTCPFFAIQCGGYDDFVAGMCNVCSTQHHCVPMGYHSYDSVKVLRERGYLNSSSSIMLFAFTGSSKPYCRVYYNVELVMKNVSEQELKREREESLPFNRKRTVYGKVAITLVDKNGEKSDNVDVFDTTYDPGDIKHKMVAFKYTGNPALTVNLDWDPKWYYDKSLNVDHLKLSSIEFPNTSITVCTENKRAVVSAPFNFLTQFTKPTSVINKIFPHRPVNMTSTYCNLNNSSDTVWEDN